MFIRDLAWRGFLGIFLERGLILELQADAMGSADRKQNQSDKILDGGMDFIFPRRDCEGTDETLP